MHKTIWSKMNHLQLKNHQRNFIIWNLQRFNIVSYLKYAGPTICFPCSYTIENNLKSDPPELNEMKALYKNFIKFYMNNCSQTRLWHLVCYYMYRKCWKDNKRPKIVLTVKKWVLTEVYEFCKSLAHCTDYKMH